MSSDTHAESIRLQESSIRFPTNSPLLSLISVVTVVGLAISLYWGALHGWSGFFRSYILNFAMIVSLALGGLFFVMVQHVTGAAWSVSVRRLAEFVTAALPWLGLVGLPILVPVWSGDALVYPWSNADEVAHDPLLQNKSAYLNPTFFTIRWGGYFAVWIFLARVFVGSSLEQDRTGGASVN